MTTQEVVSVQQADIPAAAASMASVLSQVGGKWSLRVLDAVRSPIRFTQLERSLDGVSRRMLTLTLRGLERDGLVVRTVYPTVPPKVEYCLSEIGRDLHESLVPLTDWAIRHWEAMASARSAYESRATHEDRSAYESRDAA